MSKLTHGEKNVSKFMNERQMLGEREEEWKWGWTQKGGYPDGGETERWRQTARDGDRQQEIVAVLAYWPLCFRLFIRVKISASLLT